jgi:branched-chain amino acid transport system ATP-binding protein
MLEVKNVSISFDKLAIIEDLSFKVPKGQKHAIIGPNGAGKTTIFNMLSGRYKPSKGKIIFENRNITGLSPYRINRLGLARSFQITNVFPGISVFENIRQVVLSRHRIRFNAFSRVDAMTEITSESMDILDQIHLSMKKSVSAGELSYGEQRALEIGLTIASRPKMILLDEPTAGMSMDETREAIKLIDSVTKDHTLLIIEHDMEVVFSLANIITVINYGQILTSGPPEEIRGHKKVKEAYLGNR